MLLVAITTAVQHHVPHSTLERVVQADQHVFGRAHFTEQLHVLEGAGHAAQRDRRRRASGNALTVELDRTSGRLVDAGQHVHHRALAGTVRPD